MIHKEIDSNMKKVLFLHELFFFILLKYIKLKFRINVKLQANIFYCAICSLIDLLKS